MHGPAHVRAQLAANRWSAPLPHIAICHNGPPSPEQQIWVVLLGGPPGTMLHGLSAAAQDGLQGFSPEGLSLVVPGSSRNPANAKLGLPNDWDVRVRWSGMLGPSDVNLRAVPPRTLLPRSVIDAAREKVMERRERVIILAAVQQRLTTSVSLWDARSDISGQSSATSWSGLCGLEVGCRPGVPARADVGVVIAAWMSDLAGKSRG
jgi:hypothetical protein